MERVAISQLYVFLETTEGKEPTWTFIPWNGQIRGFYIDQT
jgi:hypothetical protein